MANRLASMSRRRLDALGVTVLLVILGGAGAGISALMSDAAAEQARQQQEQTRSLLDQSRTELEAATAQRNDLLRLNDEGSGRLHSARLLNQRLHRLAVTLEQLGHRAERIEPGEPTLESGFVLVPVRVLTAADYPAVRTLFEHLHETFPDVRVTDFMLAAEDGGGSLMNLDLWMTWYGIPPDQRIATGEATTVIGAAP